MNNSLTSPERVHSTSGSGTAIDGQRNHTISSHLTRSVLALSLTLAGCDVSVRPSVSSPPATTGAAKSVENDFDTTKLDSELADLQNELTKMNNSLSLDVAQLREEVRTKVDKTEVKEMVQKELQKIRERLKQLDERADTVSQKLDKLEEHLGILPRIPEAPWYEKKEK